MKDGYYWFASKSGWIVVHVFDNGEHMSCCGNESLYEVAEEEPQNFGPMIPPPTEQ